MSDPNIVQFQEAFKRLRRVEVGNPHVGFSKRLNLLVDSFEINAPGLDRGRAKWLADITGSAHPTVSNWLKNDVVPAPEMLDLMVRFLLQHSKEINISSSRLKSWLLYGDETLNPFVKKSSNVFKPYVPLAMALISEVVEQEGIDRTSFDFARVINDTAGMLENLNINHMGQIDEIHRTLVSQCFKLFAIS